MLNGSDRIANSVTAWSSVALRNMRPVIARNDYGITGNPEAFVSSFFQGQMHPIVLGILPRGL